MSVEAARGWHRVRFSYEPPGFRYGLLLALCACAICCGSLMRGLSAQARAERPFQRSHRVRDRLGGVDIEAPGSDGRDSRRAYLKASPPIFHTAVLDRLTRVHPAVPPLMFIPAVVALAVLAAERIAAGTVAIGFLCGWALWTLAEYWTHRVVFHFEPESGIGARLHWMIHGVHHDHPNDPRRLVLPPVISVPFAVGLFALFVLVLGRAQGFAVCAGFYSGYLAYDMLHFALHHRRPRSRLGRLLYQLHMRHHFEDEQRGFGVSAPWWDVVFGTYSAGASRIRGAVRRS